jgi:drug/metabolite transporter (DMT)-like permease
MAMLSPNVSPTTATTVLPLIAASLYTVSAMTLKRSSDLGVGLWRTTFVANWIIALLFGLLWFLGGHTVDPALLWQPALIALLLFGGQVSQFLAIERGDISVAVPIFGLKVIVVAFLTPWITGDAVGIKLWIAAFLSVIGVTFLNRKNDGKRPRGLGITFAAGGFGALCFASFDVLVQRWGPQWGAGRLLPCIYGMNALLSFAIIPFFSAPLSHVPRKAWSWLIPGSAFMGLQAVTFVSTLAIYGKATSANIMYSSRGLMSVAAVWLIGHWFSNTEQSLGSRTMGWRLAGALLMMSAIVLVVTSK